MKKLLFFLSAILLLAINAFAKTTPELPKGFKQQNTGISFTENKGQVHDQNYNPRPDVLYGIMAGNMAVHIKNSGVSYQLYRVDKYKEVEDFKAPFSNGEGRGDEASQQTIYRIDLNWLNSNTNFTTTEDKALPGYSNYYVENCPNGALNVKSYKGITLNNLYNGINLHYYEKNGELKHDYIVAPHADYKQIQVQIEGAEININQDGSLLLTTPLGKIQEGAPIVYQNDKQLKAKWQIKNNTLSFEIENYNPNFELIIDPITRLWGTYYGGTGDDGSFSCTTDASGNVFMTGYTSSNTSTVIATSGSHQSAYGSGSDAFLVKFNTDGIRQWATYYGGSGYEEGRSCTIDVSGNVYLTGSTSSSAGTVIATTGSHQTVNGGGNSDAFLVKFDGNGIRQWGTYYGGSGYDVAYSCVTDASGNVYMAGTTVSNTGTIIATNGSHQSTNGGGNYDAFLVKFDASGIRQWGTYYGGSGDDYGLSCTADASGNIYLTGSTTSSTGIVIATIGSHQSAYGGGNGGGDVFLVKFDANGIRQWGTYYGGSGIDVSYSCTIDIVGNVYLAGTTSSNTGTVIASAGSHQPAFGGGIGDGFLVKFNSSGIRQWGTYYGGTGANDDGTSCVTDTFGNVYLAGTTSSTNSGVIATTGSHQSVIGGANDAFLAIFDASGVRQWATYYGGNSTDYGNSCAVDVNGNMYLSGGTLSNTGTVIATNDSYQPTFGGGGSSNYDAFLVKFRDCDILSPVAAGTASVCSGASINLSVSITGTTTPNYNWTGPNSFTSAIQNPSISNASTVNVGVYTVTVNNVGCKETATTMVASADPTVTVNSGSICIGSNFVIVPNGASTYTITGNNFTVSPSTQTSYSVTGTSASGCVSGNTAVATVTVNALPTVSVNSGSICAGSHFVITPSGANTYTVTGNNFTVSPSTQTSYSVIGKSVQGCLSSNTAVATVTVKATPSITISVSSNTICVNETGTLSASGADTYTWSTNENSTNISVSPSHTTTYSVTGTNTNACTSATSATLFVDECTGIEETGNNLSLLKIYPNPNKGVFTVEVQENTNIVVINAVGQIVYASQLFSGKQQINLESLAQGIYVVKVGNAKSSKCVKVMKE